MNIDREVDMTKETNELAATRIVGGVGTGKTQQLIERIGDLIESGAAADTILLLGATPQACCALRKRLSSAYGTAADDVVVRTARALALDVLSDAEAVRWSGRDPHILTAYEELFLLEDMKVSGLRPKRLREMLKFFYRSWTELADDDPNWLLAGEESNVHELLRANLSFTRSILEPQVANLAVNYLRTHEGARSAHSFEHVLVDDYQLNSRASQVLAEVIARRSVTIAGDRVAHISVYDSYPYAAGLDEFRTRHANAKDIELTVCHRCAASAAGAKELLADDAVPTIAFEAEHEVADEGPKTKLLVSDQPEDEFVSIAEFVASTLDGGVAAEDIVVAVPNGIWSRNIVKALAARNVPANALADRQPVRGDVRNNAKCVAARMLTALDLVADPECALAWRCWCGYNDWLTNSSAFASLRTSAEKSGKGLVESLRDAAKGANGGAGVSGDATADQIVGAKRVIDAYGAGHALIQATKGLSGAELLNKIADLVAGEDGMPAIVRSLCLGDEDDSPAAMAKRFRARLLAPTIPTTGAVSVVSFDQAVGLSPNTLIIAGFVAGFIPCAAYFDGAQMPLDKQEREHEKDVRRVYSLAGKANQQLVVSRFENTDLQTAGALKLHIGRVYLRDGARLCKIPPSEFIEQLV